MLNRISYEIINGKKVEMSSPGMNHFTVSENLGAVLRSYFKNRECMYFKECDVFLGEHTLVPDLGVVCDLSKVKNRGIYGVPDLVVEVLSKSTERYDRGEKKELYEQYGVKEYWLVNMQNKSVTIYVLKEGRFKLESHFVILDEEDQKNYENYTTLVRSTIFPEIEIELDEVFDGCDW